MNSRGEGEDLPPESLGVQEGIVGPIIASRLNAKSRPGSASSESDSMSSGSDIGGNLLRGSKIRKTWRQSLREQDDMLELLTVEDWQSKCLSLQAMVNKLQENLLVVNTECTRLQNDQITYQQSKGQSELECKKLQWEVERMKIQMNHTNEENMRLRESCQESDVNLIKLRNELLNAKTEAGKAVRELAMAQNTGNRLECNTTEERLLGTIAALKKEMNLLRTDVAELEKKLDEKRRKTRDIESVIQVRDQTIRQLEAKIEEIKSEVPTANVQASPSSSSDHSEYLITERRLNESIATLNTEVEQLNGKLSLTESNMDKWFGHIMVVKNAFQEEEESSGYLSWEGISLDQKINTLNHVMNEVASQISEEMEYSRLLTTFTKEATLKLATALNKEIQTGLGIEAAFKVAVDLVEEACASLGNVQNSVDVDEKPRLESLMAEKSSVIAELSSSLEVERRQLAEEKAKGNEQENLIVDLKRSAEELHLKLQMALDQVKRKEEEIKDFEQKLDKQSSTFNDAKADFEKRMRDLEASSEKARQHLVSLADEKDAIILTLEKRLKHSEGMESKDATILTLEKRLKELEGMESGIAVTANYAECHKSLMENLKELDALVDERMQIMAKYHELQITFVANGLSDSDPMVDEIRTTLQEMARITEKIMQKKIASNVFAGAIADPNGVMHPEVITLLQHGVNITDLYSVSCAENILQGVCGGCGKRDCDHSNCIQASWCLHEYSKVVKNQLAEASEELKKVTENLKREQALLYEKETAVEQLVGSVNEAVKAAKIKDSKFEKTVEKLVKLGIGVISTAGTCVPGFNRTFSLEASTERIVAELSELLQETPTPEFDRSDDHTACVTYETSLVEMIKSVVGSLVLVNMEAESTKERIKVTKEKIASQEAAAETLKQELPLLLAQEYVEVTEEYVAAEVMHTTSSEITDHKAEIAGLKEQLEVKDCDAQTKIEEIERLNEVLQELQREMSILKGQLEQSEMTNSTITQELESMKAQLTEAETIKSSIQAQLAREETSRLSITEELEALKAHPAEVIREVIVEKEAQLLDTSGIESYKEEISKLKAEVEEASAEKAKLQVDLLAKETFIRKQENDLAHLRDKIHQDTQGQAEVIPEVKVEREAQLLDTSKIESYKEEISKLRADVEEASAEKAKLQVDLLEKETFIRKQENDLAHLRDKIHQDTQGQAEVIPEVKVKREAQLLDTSKIESYKEEISKLRADVEEASAGKAKLLVDLLAKETFIRKQENDLAHLRDEIHQDAQGQAEMQTIIDKLRAEIFGLKEKLEESEAAKLVITAEMGALKELNQETEQQATKDDSTLVAELTEKLKTTEALNASLSVEIESTKAIVENEKAIGVELKNKLETSEANVRRVQARFAQCEADLVAVQESQATRNMEMASKSVDTAEVIEVVLKEPEPIQLQVEEKLVKVRDVQESQEYIKLQLEVEKLVAILSVKDNELAQYKEQVQQHAMTIVAIEERLNHVIQKNKEYREVIEQQTIEIKSLEEKTTVIECNGSEMKAVVHTPDQGLSRLQRENVTLRKQYEEAEKVIVALRRDIAGLGARLGDMAGDVDEATKKELDDKRMKLSDADREIATHKTKVKTLFTTIDEKLAETKRLNGEIRKLKEAIIKLKKLVVDRDGTIKGLEEKIVSLGKEKEKQKSEYEEQGKITKELAAQGSQCRGERHGEVITNQRSALTELRGHIRSLELWPRPAPSHEEALQQVMMLKKELAELRVRDSLSMVPSSLLTVDTTQNTDNANMEKNAHLVTMETLDYSENSYMALLQAVSAALDIADIAGLRRLAHLPSDEQLKLFREREQACTIVSNRISLVRERLKRKEELLVEYEQNLARLHQLEEVSGHQERQVSDLTNEIRQRTEESDCLRVSLERARTRIEPNMRYVTAINDEKLPMLHTHHHHHSHSVPPDPRTAKVTNAKIKNASELAKKKDYEIKTLKTELIRKENELNTFKRAQHPSAKQKVPIPPKGRPSSAKVRRPAARTVKTKRPASAKAEATSSEFVIRTQASPRVGQTPRETINESYKVISSADDIKRSLETVEVSEPVVSEQTFVTEPVIVSEVALSSPKASQEGTSESVEVSGSSVRFGASTEIGASDSFQFGTTSTATSGMAPGSTRVSGSQFGSFRSSNLASYGASTEFAAALASAMGKTEDDSGENF